MSAAKPPFLGFGLGLRPQHYAEILNGSPEVDWFEVLSENYMVEGGQPLRMLDRICERYPVVMHGVSLSIASTSPLDLDYLTRLKALAARVNPKWISDHLCWTGVHGVNLHDLLPIPYTREALDHVVDRVSQVQDFLGRRLTLENVSSYVTFGRSEMTEWEFVSEVANRADCWLLFDVNNAYVSAYNHGFSADDLNGVPRDRVVQFHVAGHSHEESHIVDTHDYPVCDEVWDVYRAAVAHFGPVSTMIERDDNIPPLAELVDELDHARGIAREVLGVPHPRRRGMSSLKDLQESFQRGILAGDETILGEIKDSAKEERKALFGVYRHAYVARLAEVLADDYEQLHAYLGDAGFAKLAKSYIAAHPSDRKSARDFGRHVPEFLKTDAGFAKHPELAEIASLEKALADAFDGPDAEPLKLARLAEIAPELWAKLAFTPHPTAHRLTFTTNAADIWSSLREEAAPPPARLMLEPQALLVWRQDVTARFRTLGPEEATMWDEATAGTRFGVLCEMVATHGGEEGADFRAATYLKDWVDMESLADCRLVS